MPAEQVRQVAERLKAKREAAFRASVPTVPPPVYTPTPQFSEQSFAGDIGKVAMQIPKSAVRVGQLARRGDNPIATGLAAGSFPLEALGVLLGQIPERALREFPAGRKVADVISAPIKDIGDFASRATEAIKRQLADPRIQTGLAAARMPISSKRIGPIIDESVKLGVGAGSLMLGAKGAAPLRKLGGSPTALPRRILNLHKQAIAETGSNEFGTTTARNVAGKIGVKDAVELHRRAELWNASFRAAPDIEAKKAIYARMMPERQFPMEVVDDFVKKHFGPHEKAPEGVTKYDLPDLEARLKWLQAGKSPAKFPSLIPK